WWGDVQNDLKGLAAQDFRGLVEAWATSIIAALEADGAKGNPLDHPLIKRLLPQYLDTIAGCELKQAELDARIKAAQPSDDEEEGEDSSDSDERLSDEEIKALKKELAAAKKQLK